MSTRLGFPGQPSPRKHGTAMQTLLRLILWANAVIKGRNKICLDLKTAMMLLIGFRPNHGRVDLKLIMKQNWLLGVENDEVIVRNGYGKKDLKI